MKKNEEKSFEAQNVGLCRQIQPQGDNLKEAELVEQVLSTRDNKRLSLHVVHGTVAIIDLQQVVSDGHATHESEARLLYRDLGIFPG